MLVLTRKQAETIQIGDDIIIKVIQTGRGAIKLGIDAPTDVRILRGEVAEAAGNAGQTVALRPQIEPVRPFAPRTDLTESVRGEAL